MINKYFMKRLVCARKSYSGKFGRVWLAHPWIRNCLSVVAGALVWALSTQAQTLTSVYDTTPPAGQSYFIGFAGSSSTYVLDVTLAETYASLLYSETGLTFSKIFDVTPDIQNMDTTSLVTQYTGNTLLYTSFAAFSNTVTSYTWSLAGQAPLVTLFSPAISLDQLPSGMAVGQSGQVYFATDSGIHEYANLTTSISTTFGNSGPGQLSGAGALAVGPDGTVYAMDPGNNRIALYSATGGPSKRRSR